MAIKKTLLLLIVFMIFSCNKKEIKITNLYDGVNRNSTIYLTINNDTLDKLILKNDYYGKSKLNKFDDLSWVLDYTSRCGSSCSSENLMIFSVKNNKIYINLNIQSSYKEGIIGDTTFKKYFKKEIKIKKLKLNELELKKICIKNDVEFYSKKETLRLDKNNQTYYNQKYMFENKIYKGIRIDSSEYIFYNNKWFEFSNKEQRIYPEI